MMADCYVTSTGICLPGSPVENNSIDRYLGMLDGELEVRQRVLEMNGITKRYYALDDQQNPTADVYTMAASAIKDCMLKKDRAADRVSLLAGGATYAPLAAPGIASRVHDQLAQQTAVAEAFSDALEISSHSGVCTSSSAALAGAIRGIESGMHQTAVAFGAEHSSEVLKSSKIRPVDDRNEHDDVSRSQWYMSVFLRFMLSDGAGAVLLRDRPDADGVSLKVNWTFSRSFAHKSPLCMKLDNSNALLSQDVRILARHLLPRAKEFCEMAFSAHDDSLRGYRWVLPHLSSFLFRRRMERMLGEFAGPQSDVDYWTNLSTAGNTGAASIFIMLDQFLKEKTLDHGDKVLLFIPESGQFNFVMISLTAVVNGMAAR